MLARLHAVDYEAVGLGDFGRPAGYLARQVARWQTQWEKSKTVEMPVVDEVAQRLERRLPADSRHAIVHGDYSFNNTMFRRDDPTRIQAVLDWEMSTLGDPLTDVGMVAVYWTEVGEIMWRNRKPQAHRANAGFPDVDSLLERYAVTSGTDLSQIDFYRAFATYKLAVIAQGARGASSTPIPSGRPGVTGTVAPARRPRARVDGGVLMTVSLGGVASPVDFDHYGDYAPPPGAYVQRGDIATLTYPIDGRITDDGSSPFRRRTRALPPLLLALLPVGAAAADRAQAPRARRHRVVVRGRPGARRSRLGLPRGPGPRTGSGERLHVVAGRVPGDRPWLRRPHLGARAVGSRDQPAGQQPLRDHDHRPRDAVRRVGRPCRRPVPGGPARRHRAHRRGDRAHPGDGRVRGDGRADQEAYDAISSRVYDALASFEARLGQRRFLVGDGITDADLLLYVNLIRFDAVAVPLGRLTRQRLVDHPHLWAYVRDLYARPAFRETTDLDHIVRGTFGTGAGIRSNRIVPRPPRRRLGRAARSRHPGLIRAGPGYRRRAKLSSWPSGSRTWKYRSPHGRIGRRHLRLVAVGPGACVHHVDVGDPEDDPAPDRRHRGVRRVELDVQEARARRGTW